MRRDLLLLSFVSFFGTTACDPVDVRSGSLSGHLLFNLEPGVESLGLDGFTILVEGPQVESTATDEGGGFVVASLEPGSYAVSADMQLWSRETNAKVTVEVIAGEHTIAPDLNVTPAGMVSGHITIHGGGDPSGFRVQLLSTGLAAVADADGDFIIHRVPGKAAPGYELLAERADVGSARRAGILVVPFSETRIGTLTVYPGGSSTANAHPYFDSSDIIFESNGTPLQEAVVPLPYLLPDGFVRRFDQVALRAPATDPDGDILSYEWSASAGTLINPLAAEARWRPDEYAGSQATISVTARDGHGGIASMSSDIDILDLFAGSAHRHGDRVVHSYRIEGGPWRVDVVDLAHASDSGDEDPWTPDLSETLLEIATPTDPRPLLFASCVVYRDNGDLMRVDLDTRAIESLGLRPGSDTVADPKVTAAPPVLLVITEATPWAITAFDVEARVSWEAAVCDASCLRIAADTGGDGFVTLYGADVFLFDSGTVRIATAPVGRGLTLYDGALSYVAREAGYNGRSVVARILATGNQQSVYEGFYDITVWSQEGEDILITEQEYRALRHPPFVRWINTTGGWQGDYRPNAAGWMPERVHGLHDGIALIRQITRADWPEPFDESRSEIARVEIARANE